MGRRRRGSVLSLSLSLSCFLVDLRERSVERGMELEGEGGGGKGKGERGKVGERRKGEREELGVILDFFSVHTFPEQA